MVKTETIREEEMAAGTIFKKKKKRHDSVAHQQYMVTYVGVYV